MIIEQGVMSSGRCSVICIYSANLPYLFGCSPAELASCHLLCSGVSLFSESWHALHLFIDKIMTALNYSVSQIVPLHTSWYFFCWNMFFSTTYIKNKKLWICIGFYPLPLWFLSSTLYFHSLLACCRNTFREKKINLLAQKV